MLCTFLLPLMFFWYIQVTTAHCSSSVISNSAVQTDSQQVKLLIYQQNIPVTQNKARFPMPPLNTWFSPIIFAPHPYKPQDTAIKLWLKSTTQHCLYIATYLLLSKSFTQGQKTARNWRIRSQSHLGRWGGNCHSSTPTHIAVPIIIIRTYRKSKNHSIS